MTRFNHFAFDTKGKKMRIAQFLEPALRSSRIKHQTVQDQTFSDVVCFLAGFLSWRLQ